jgi:hypothetical protein
MPSPADVAATLVPDTIIGGASGWAVRIGKMPDTPARHVVFYDSGGMNPNPRWRVDFPTFQVRVRGGNGEYGVAYDKIRQIRDALLGLDSQDVGPDRWVSVIVMGDIAFVGYESDRPEFTVNFRVIIEPASGANRESL